MLVRVSVRVGVSISIGIGIRINISRGIGVGVGVGIWLHFLLKKNPSLLFFDNESVKTGIKLLASLLSYIP